jgi:hypothetical protein
MVGFPSGSVIIIMVIVIVINVRGDQKNDSYIEVFKVTVVLKPYPLTLKNGNRKPICKPFGNGGFEFIIPAMIETHI